VAFHVQVRLTVVHWLIKALRKMSERGSDNQKTVRAPGNPAYGYLDRMSGSRGFHWRSVKADDFIIPVFQALERSLFCRLRDGGCDVLSQGMRIVSAAGKEGAWARRWVMCCGFIVYAFVGSQMAWTLRPFIGAPSMKFELFRQLGGNFYSNILASIGEFLGSLWYGSG